MRAILIRGAVLGTAWWAVARADPESIWLGIAAVAIATAASIRLLPPADMRLRPFGAIRLAGFFVRESLVGGIDVARRAFSRRPAERTRECFTRFETELPEGPARAFFTGMIGLLPGSVAADLRDGELLVHMLDRELADENRLRALERHVASAFGVGPPAA